MSNFITKADYYTGKRQQVIDQLIDDDDSLLDEAEKDAIDLVTTKLHHYDTETIFSQVGDDRDRTVLRWCKYIALYYLYNRTDDAFIPESVVKNYDDTMDQLDRLSNAREFLDLPRKLNEDETKSSKFRSGGSKPRSVF